MNGKKYQVYMLSALTTPVNLHSNGQEIIPKGFDTVEEAAKYAESQKDNYPNVRVLENGKRIITYQDGIRNDESDLIT